MEIVSIYKDMEYGEQQPAMKVLMNNAYTKEVRIVFRKGQALKEHTAPHPIVVQVVEGRIDFGTNNKRCIMERGALITLEAHVLHDVKAEEDSIVRLSLHKSNTWWKEAKKKVLIQKAIEDTEQDEIKSEQEKKPTKMDKLKANIRKNEVEIEQMTRQSKPQNPPRRPNRRKGL